MQTTHPNLKIVKLQGVFCAQFPLSPGHQEAMENVKINGDFFTKFHFRFPAHCLTVRTLLSNARPPRVKRISRSTPVWVGTAPEKMARETDRKAGALVLTTRDSWRHFAR